MLAAAAPAVKLQDLGTPEQRGCSMAIDQALTTFWNLVERLHAAADDQQPVHHVEETLFRQLLVIGQDLLRAFLARSGDGDVGPTLTIPGNSPSDPPQVLPRLETPRCRPYLSIFGEVTIQRVCYGHDRVEAAPLDARLHLPRRQYSYLLQQWLGAFVIDDAHAEAVQKLQTILGLSISVKASEDLNREQASDVEPFQDSRPVPEPSQEGSIGPLGCGRRRGGGGRDAGGSGSVIAASSSWQGSEGQHEADGGGGGGLHHRTVRPHDR
jgi:hypothetical protein